MTQNRKEVGIRLSVQDKEVAIRALQQFGKEGKDALEAIKTSGRPASDGLKAVNDGAKLAQGGLRNMAGEAGTLGRILSRGGLLGLGLAAVLATLAMVGKATIGVAKELGSLRKDAERSGLNVESYQEFTHVANRLRIDQQAIADGFRELNIRAGEFATNGGGSAAEAFAAIGMTQEQVQEGLRNTDQFISVIIERLRTLSTSDRIRFADEIFGGQGGEQFVSMINAGSEAIAEMRQEARDLGLVFSQDVFDKAAEVEEKFTTIARVLDTNFKQAVIELGPLVANFLSTLLEGVRQVKVLLDLMSGSAGPGAGLGGNQAWTELLSPEQRDAMNLRLRLGNKAGENLYDGFTFGKDGKIDLAQPWTPIADGGKGGVSSIDKLARDAEQLIRRLRSASEEYAATMATLNAMLSRKLIDQETYNRAVAEAVLKRAESVETEQDYVEALRLVEEARANGIIGERAYTEAVEEMTRRRLEVQNDWSAGFQLGMLRIVEQSRDVAKQVSDAWASAFSGAEDALVSLVQTGKGDVKQLADSIIADLLRISIRQGITGPLASFMGNLFGGGTPAASIYGRSVSYAPGVGYMPVAHDGWTVGRGNPPGTRAALAGLNRFHIGGLNRGERLIVAEDGEGIFTPRQMDNADGIFRALMRVVTGLAQQPAASGAPRVEIHNYSSEPIREETRTGPDGVDVTYVIVGAVTGAIADGRMDGVMGSVYGLKRRGQ